MIHASVLFHLISACSLSAVSNFGVGSGAFEISGMTSGCTVEVSVERC